MYRSFCRTSTVSPPTATQRLMKSRPSVGDLKTMMSPRLGGRIAGRCVSLNGNGDP
jgi:hypothetical protein